MVEVMVLTPVTQLSLGWPTSHASDPDMIGVTHSSLQWPRYDWGDPHLTPVTQLSLGWPTSHASDPDMTGVTYSSLQWPNYHSGDPHLTPVTQISPQCSRSDSSQDQYESLVAVSTASDQDCFNVPKTHHTITATSRTWNQLQLTWNLKAFIPHIP